jgi:SAM-dependent methyltransferase
MEYYEGQPVCADAMWRQEIASVVRWCQGDGLDPGAGGRTLRPEITCCDLQPTHASQLCGNACALTYVDATFDFVLTVHLLEHLAEPRHALQEWLRVVRPGGRVVCVIPNTIYTLGQNTDATPHRHEWSPPELALEVLGLSPTPWDAETTRPWLAWCDARLVQFSEACPQWSLAMVLRKEG